MTPAQKSLGAIPRTVWLLGFVSLLMDLSSELIHSLLPLYLVGTLGVSILTVGVIEGIAEATALIVKVLSGAISDFTGRRKGLLLLGYGLAAVSKPLFPLAGSAGMVFLARFLDRIGKGIRGAPRDALVSDVTPPAVRGASFGLRQSMDTVGALLGPALAVVLMLAFDGDIARVLWVAVVPALLALALLAAGVREPARPTAPRHWRSPIDMGVWRRFPVAYWWVVGIGALFALARFSEAFLVLRVQQLGLSAAWVPLAMVVMSLFYALSAYPAGKWSDRVGRKVFLAGGLALLIAADVVLASATSVAWVLAGVGLWGFHMGLSQGILAALVADTTPNDLKGTAFGVFNLVSGICMLPASIIAGWVWQRYGAPTTFHAGAVFALAALALLLANWHATR